jgi:nitroreductase/NAD-dependent dihydropyrimidine dehydrogenase PreA subunit
MKQVAIDNNICTGCGLCAEICPYRAIALVENKAEYILDDCFLCGQCQAVCPTDAVAIDSLGSELGLVTLQEFQKAIAPGQYDAATLVNLMRSRRSCRLYKNKKVPLDVLEDLVKIGTTAPSGTNSQAWNFVILPTRGDVLVLGEMTADYFRKLNRQAESRVLRGLIKVFGRDTLGQYYKNYHDSVADALNEWDEQGIDRLFHGATATILVTGKRSASCPAEDALLASQNILLAAHAMGLGTCLIGFAVEALRRTPEMRKKMMIPDDEHVYSVIAIGYPAVNYVRPANRRVVVPRLLTS